MIYLLPWENHKYGKAICIRKYLLETQDPYRKYGTHDIYIWREGKNYNFYYCDEISSYPSEIEAREAYDKLLTVEGRYFLIPEDSVEKYKILL